MYRVHFSILKKKCLLLQKTTDFKQMAYYYEDKQIFTAGDMLDVFKNNFDWDKFNSPNVEFNPNNAHAFVLGAEKLTSGWVNTGIIVDGLPIYEGFGQMDPVLRYNMPMGSIGSKSASGGLALGLRVPRIRTSYRVDDIDKIRGFVLSGIRAKLTPYQDFQILISHSRPNSRSRL